MIARTKQQYFIIVIENKGVYTNGFFKKEVVKFSDFKKALKKAKKINGEVQFVTEIYNYQRLNDDGEFIDSHTI